jgi:oxygen-independent coproporphyrinogen-3 oxidase
LNPPAVPPLGIYVHWPYCARLCPYCDFNVVRDRRRAEEKEGLTAAIIADLAAHAALIGGQPDSGPRLVSSIFFGGGTPSLMDPAMAAQIIQTVRRLWTPADDLEITLEANPTDAESGRFAAFAEAGVTRLSLGIQSLDDRSLRLLGRNHDAASALRAVGVARGAFARLSVDLIYALPGQSSAAWADELAAVVALEPEHISAYQLTIEEGTAFHRAVRRGSLKPAPADLAADLYETTQRVLGEAGYHAYEVSNHARGRAARSRHNLTYWRGGDYVGVGPGAHGRLSLGQERWASVAPDAVAGYVEGVGRGGAGSRRERLTAREIALERLLMGLRTDEGVALGDLAPLEIAPARLAGLDGLARVCAGRLTATAKGRLVLDRLIAELIAG